MLLSLSFCSGSPCTTNSAHPQCKQIVTGGNTQTVGLSRFSAPGKWMFISAENTRISSELQNLQAIPLYLTFWGSQSGMNGLVRHQFTPFCDYLVARQTRQYATLRAVCDDL